MVWEIRPLPTDIRYVMAEDEPDVCERSPGTVHGADKGGSSLVSLAACDDLVSKRFLTAVLNEVELCSSSLDAP